MTIREAGKGEVIGDSGPHDYLIGFINNDGIDDETELTARNMKELEELWRSLCPEFDCKVSSVTYVEMSR